MSARIEVEVGASIAELQKKMQAASVSVSNFSVNADGSIGRFSKSITDLERQLKTFQSGLKNATDPSRIALLNTAIGITQQKLDQTNKAVNGSGFKNFSVGTNQAAFALNNLGRVAQDAPFGFIGIQNNLNPLLESFQQLKQQTGSTGSALKALGSSLMGPAGLGIALSVVSAGILLYQQYTQKAKKDVDGATESIKKQREELIKTPYEKAVVELSNITRNVGLAKEGFLNKTAVLKQYNEGIGLTIGKVTSLDAAEQALVKNGGKYLQLMFLKASAEVAFKKAAEESYNQAKKQQELDAKKPVLPEKLNMSADRSEKKIKKSLIAPLSDFKNLLDDTGGAIDGVSKRIDKINPKSAILYIDQQQLTELKGNTDKAANIAMSAQQQVIDFAKKNGFNLNGIFDVKIDKKDFERMPEITYRASFDIKGLRNEGLSDTIKDIKATEDSFNSLGQTIKNVTFEIPPILDKFTLTVQGILNEGLIASIGGIGEAIGAALASGNNALEAAGGALLGTLGGVLIQLGQLAIQTGIGISAIKKALTSLNPVVAIAAGVALVALGAFVKGKAANIGGGSSSEKTTPTRKIPGFATGVKNFSGGLAVVGERGPELVNLPKGSDVIANNRLGSMMSSNTVIVKGDLGIEMGKLVVAFKQEEALRGRRG